MLDYQVFVDACTLPCAVLSVERTDEDQCGQINIVCANQAYRQLMGPNYRNGMPYDELVPKDLKFEDFCFRAAFLNQRMHSYVQTKALDTWTDLLLIPMQPQSERLGYCQFVVEMTQHAEPVRLAGVSLDTAAAVVRACMTLVSGDDFEQSVSVVLSDIMEMSEANICRILLVDELEHRVSVFCERRRHGTPARLTIAYETAMAWEQAVGKSSAVVVKGPHDMAELEKRSPDMTDMMRERGVKTLVLVPFRRKGATFGYLYVSNYNVEHVVEVKELVELMAYFLGSEIFNHMLMTRMKQLSNVDALTGLLNRNAMIQRVKQYAQNPSGMSFGVVNIDLNGLKHTNDTLGHDAGDRLLIEASELLRKVFYEQDIYRTGGDEFIVLTDGIGKDVFERKLQRLRYMMHKNQGVNFAVGSFWSDGTTEIHKAFRRADEDMYANKRLYYIRHPEFSR